MAIDASLSGGKVTVRLLFVGDIHLGRRPTRLPDDWSLLGLSAAELTPAAAWRDCVDHALATRPDAVVLAGDVVDALDDRFEAFSLLRTGVDRLLQAGIATFAVAGNHDVEVLPRLAAQIPGFRLIGAGGEWECVSVASRDGDALRLLGWSFPSPVVEESPLASLRFQPQPGVATLGVLHCDLDAGRGPYAPVRRSELARVPVDAWLLGHLHRPDALTGSRPIGYLGSLVGLDPGEPGSHGPWWVEVEGPQRVRARPLPLARLRWERAECVVAAQAPERAADAFFEELRDALRAIHERLTAVAPTAARVVGCRLRVSGPGRHCAEVQALMASPERWPQERFDDVHYFIEKLEEHAIPDLDLDALARGEDPPGLLARRLVALRDRSSEADALVAAFAPELEGALSGTRWQRLSTPLPDPEGLREILLTAGTRRLEALLLQAAGQAGERP
jgi:hypothetical protein